MGRLEHVVNALVVAVAAIIARNERQDPARRGPMPAGQHPPPGAPVTASPPAAEDGAPSARVADSLGRAGPEQAARREERTTAATKRQPTDALPPANGDRADPSATVAADVSTDDTPTPEPEPARTATADAHRDESPGTVPAGAVPGDGSTACPPDFPIKGNASSMIYHRPGQPSYERTQAEFCFATEEAASAAGYRPPKR